MAAGTTIPPRAAAAGSAASVLEFAEDELALDLQPDEEEEDRH